MSLQHEMKFDYPFLTQDGPDYSFGSEDCALLEGLLTKEEPVCYIANIQDGTIIGYKYFQGNGEEMTLTLRLRGRAEGAFQVKAGLGKDAPILGNVLATVFSTSSSFQSFSACISLPKDCFSLYLLFKGSGWLDMKELSFGAEKIDSEM